VNPQRHSLAVGIVRVETAVIITVKVTGQLTHADYDMIDRLVDAALRDLSPPLLGLIDAMELDGWEPRAFWDKTTFGWKHGDRFQKIAIIEDKQWLQRLSNIGHWFTAGELRYFQDAGNAWDWLLHE
jgi:hypothetical protein